VEIYEGSVGKPMMSATLRNLRDFPRALTWSALTSGLLIVLISCTGPVAMVLQAARVGHFNQNQTASWLWACWVGSGVFGLLLSLRYRIPIIGAWSTPSVALLITGLADHSLAEAVSAYFVSAALIVLVGITGIFQKLLDLVPRPVIMAMLAGVLFDFGVELFRQLPTQPAIVIAMLLAYFIARRFGWRAPVVSSLLIGLIVAFWLDEVKTPHLSWSLANPVFVSPEFSFSSMLTLALPLTLLTLTTQYAPGMAVLTNSGYPTPTNTALIFGGALSFLGSPFLGSGVNSAAITAAIGAGPEAEPDASRRYTAGVVCGLTYILIGLMGATMVGLFGTLPSALLAALAGLGLLPAIGSSTHDSLSDPQYREAAMVTLLLTVSGMHPLSLGAPFWGLLAGVATHLIAKRIRA